MARAANINDQTYIGTGKIAYIGTGKIATTKQNLAAARLQSAPLDLTNELVDTDEWSMSASLNVRNHSGSAFLARGEEAVSEVTLQAGVTLPVEDPSTLLSAP